MGDKATLGGGCHCGAVRFEVDVDPEQDEILDCNCSICAMKGFLHLIVPPERFRIVEGNDLLTTFESSEHGRRQFCKTCGTQLFCWHEKSDGSAPDFIDITLASISDPIDRQPEMHFYFDSGADWITVNDELPKLGGATGTEPLDKAE